MVETLRVQKYTLAMASELDDDQRPVLTLDAMGVLYAASDDVAELLIPFARRCGSPVSDEDIEREYLAASPRDIDAATFWTRIGSDPKLEENYLAEHRLTPGVLSLVRLLNS